MALDGLTLLGTSLNDETNYGLEELDFGPPPKRLEWAQVADADGSDLVRQPLFENRVVTMKLRVGKQASMNAALEKVGSLVDLFQECEKNPEGSPLVWTPATGTKKYTLYALTGQITSVPIVIEGSSAGFYVFSPQLLCSLVCRPFGYGEEEEVRTAKSIETGLSIVTFTLASIKGDVPAEGRLVLKDTAKVGRRTAEWFLEQRYYNAETALFEGAESLTPVGGAKSEAANTGAYKPGAGTKLTIATTLVGESTVCAETAALKHVGAFRVKCRGQVVLGSESVAGNVYVRLSYQDGEGPFRANEWQPLILAGKYVELDLGPVTLTEKLTGTQKWVGRIEAYSANAAAKDVFHINYMVYGPTEGYGKAAGPTVTGGGTITAYDNFEAYTLASALNTKTPPVGAAWATSGAATDWEIIETSGGAGNTKNKKVSRKTKSDAEPRFGQLGGSLGASAVTAVVISTEKPTGGEHIQGVVLRWTNATNYAFGLVRRNTGGGGGNRNFVYSIGTVVAGVTTVLGESSAFGPLTGEVGTEMTLSATLDGTLTLKVANGGPTLSATSVALKTGEALKEGKAGIYDRNTGTTEIARTIDNVSVVTLPGVPFVLQSERSMEFRSEATITQDSTGTYSGPVQQARGGRFFVPQAGQAARTSRVLVKADRNDLEEADQQTIGDTFTAACFVTPRYSVIPR